MYFLYVSRSEEKNWGDFFLDLPPEKAVFIEVRGDWQNFVYRLFIPSIILNGNMVISVVFSSLDRHCKKTTEMIRGEKRLYFI